MFIYNVTVGIDKDVEEEWVLWMKETHIPRVMNTGLFIDNKMYKVLTEDEGNISYSIQYFAESLDHIERYLGQFAQELIKEHNEKYLNKHVAFRTLLQSID